MSQSEKAAYYRALKQSGVKFPKHYRDYSTQELKEAYDKLTETVNAEQPAAPPPSPSVQTAPDFDANATYEALQKLRDPAAAPPQPQASRDQPDLAARRPVTLPVRGADPNEMPGQRLNTHGLDEPIRVDEAGRVWYQEEVLKPAAPRPRGRRVLKYMESGVQTEQVQDGKYVETFEVAGQAASRPAEAKITLPSYQVGIYKDPRFPFRIHVYNGRQGFDLFEVQKFYGGPELVPMEIKRVYVENVLCYDIRTTVRAIQTEYRQLQLAGRIQ